MTTTEREVFVITAAKKNKKLLEEVGIGYAPAPVAAE